MKIILSNEDIENILKEGKIVPEGYKLELITRITDGMKLWFEPKVKEWTKYYLPKNRVRMNDGTRKHNKNHLYEMQ